MLNSIQIFTRILCRLAELGPIGIGILVAKLANQIPVLATGPRLTASAESLKQRLD
jgi:hypothetical protein